MSEPKKCPHCDKGRTPDDLHCEHCNGTGAIVSVDSPPPTDGQGGDTGN